MRLTKIALFLAVLLLSAAGAQAKDNFCAECHTSAEMAAFGAVTDWDRSIFQVKDTSCPGVLELRREVFFTESRLVKYDMFLTELEHETRRYPEYMREDLVKQGVRFADLEAAGTPMSIAGMAGPNLKIKKSMHEIYEKLNKLRGDDTLEYVLGFGLAGTMLVMLLFSLGLKNTLKE